LICLGVWLLTLNLKMLTLTQNEDCHLVSNLNYFKALNGGQKQNINKSKFQKTTN
jgi:hypothetical protein